MTELPAESVMHPVRLAAAVVASIGVGAMVAAQTRINGEFGARLGDGFLVAAISFGSGLLMVAVAIAVLPSGRRGLGRVATALRSRTTPWWYTLGGAAGAAFVLGQGVLGGVLGVALFTVGIVAGQTVSSLLIDRRGLGTIPARSITPQRLIGAILAVIAVVVAGSGELQTRVPIGLVVVPIVIGLLVGAQPALNGQVRVVAGSAMAATFINFAVGTAILGVAAVVNLGIVGWPTRFPTDPSLYLGGVLGVFLVAAQTVLVRPLGVLLMDLAVLAGQLAAAVLFDVALSLPGHEPTLVTLVGAAVTLVAVGIAAIPPRTRLRGSSGSASR